MKSPAADSPVSPITEKANERDRTYFIPLSGAVCQKKVVRLSFFQSQNQLHPGLVRDPYNQCGTEQGASLLPEEILPSLRESAGCADAPAPRPRAGYGERRQEAE